MNLNLNKRRLKNLINPFLFLFLLGIFNAAQANEIFAIYRCDSFQGKKQFQFKFPLSFKADNKFESKVKYNSTVGQARSERTLSGFFDGDKIEFESIMYRNGKETIFYPINVENLSGLTEENFKSKIRMGVETQEGSKKNQIRNCKLAFNKNAINELHYKFFGSDGNSEVAIQQAKPASKPPSPSKNYSTQDSSDTNSPSIEIVSASSDGKKGTIRGKIFDNEGIAEILIDGQAIKPQSNGSFEYQTFVPANGLNVRITATDFSGLSAEKMVFLERSNISQAASITFDRLNPLGRSVRKNDNAIALVVGIANYENTSAKAIYADSDALMFKDYASEKLGIPENRIKTMVNDKADERELLLSVKSWLSRSIREQQTDVFIFFAGHGLASEDGEEMYLLPYDGAPELLDKTAILRNELFSDIASANPRSVTVFFDTCYSGSTRGTESLIASRPIAIRAKKSAIPDGFTLLTAAGGDQTAKPLEEAKHGMFSYFLMKGMEGDADANQDNQITAGELHEYVRQNVIQQSSGSQTPELQGDADRVLVRFQ